MTAGEGNKHDGRGEGASMTAGGASWTEGGKARRTWNELSADAGAIPPPFCCYKVRLKPRGILKKRY